VKISREIRDSLILVAQRLGPLADDVAFLGGAIVGLLLTDPGAPTPRATRDVDLIIEVLSRADHERLEARLLEFGFREVAENGVVVRCRWTIEGVLVDVMPTDEAILGFSNSWYLPALQHAQRVIVSDTSLRVVSAPYFVATKLEAYRRRGDGDFLGSRDIADVIAILDGRKELVDELAAGPRDVREFVAREFRAMLDRGELDDAVSAHLRPDPAIQGRASLVLGQLHQILTSVG